MNRKTAMWISLLVFLLMLEVLLVPSMTSGQVISYYGNNAKINPVAFTLMMSNPTNEATYSKVLPLEFSLIWNVSLESLLPTHQVIKGCAYSIDDHQLVAIAPKGPLMIYGKESYWYSYPVDISNLTQGNHKISVIAFQYYGNSSFQGLFNQSSTPITFLVDNTKPTPTPTVPEFTSSAILPLFAATLFITLRLKHRSKNMI